MVRINRKYILSATVVAILLFVVFSYAWITEQSRALTQEEVAVDDCSRICKSSLSNSKDISNGPCLANEVNRVKGGWLVEKWVCDVAHNPRQAVDDLPENQCSAYREGKARHFVEVDETCNLIRVV